MNTFRWVGFAEGLSLLILMGIAMPLKYVYGEPLAVKYVGWIHGLLFVVYVALLAILSSENGWPRRRTAFGFIGAVLPFGTFVFDHYLQRELAEKA